MSTIPNAEDLFSVFADSPSSENSTSLQEKKRTLTEHKKDSRSIPAASFDNSISYKSEKTGKKIKVEACVDKFSESVLDEPALKQEAKIESTAEESSEDSIILSHQVRHEVAIPSGFPYVPLPREPCQNPARVYPFKLDPFQAVSIACIERGESVLVSAHTSAGKTVVAEYAIALALREKQRVIYTSPIKALSNQKYRELLEEFTDVGLMTGDVSLNPNASCLVMTTEILRSMLYRGSELLREVSWVVFDEIHYMRDKERGVVWEETLILLPTTVKHVFLSATIPNALQFAEWITSLTESPVHVVYTDYRPTPLQHYLFPQGSDGIYLVVDEKGSFREDNFQKAVGVISSGSTAGGVEDVLGAKGSKIKKKTPTSGPSDLYKIVKMILLKNYHPVIIFSFSKKECESNAMQLSKIDFNNDNEKELVLAVFTNATAGLSEDDKKLPQILNILPLLKRGIGIHHSGLLPILKEVIELLFQEGLLKVLFATETFSIGLNMPARTVVFTNIRKFDGKDFRTVSSGEYIQMSGRAGRRGLDDRGIVIMMLDEKLEPSVAKSMLRGEADRLNSAFHLSYNMILNLMRVEGFSPEMLLQKCFFQFQQHSSLPGLQQKLSELTDQLNGFKIENEQTVADYYSVKKALTQLSNDYKKIVHAPIYILPFLQPGRLVRVVDQELDFGWCVLLNLKETKSNDNQASAKERKGSDDEKIIVIDVLMKISAEKRTRKPCSSSDEKYELCIVPVTLSVLNAVSSIRLFLPKDLRSLEQREIVYKSIQEALKRFSNELPLLDPSTDLKINDEAFSKLTSKIEALEDRLVQNPLSLQPEELERLYFQYNSKMEILDSINIVKKEVKATQSILQLDELKSRKRVLRRLGFTTQDDVIEIKGRVACEISTGDELLLTELMFSGVFSSLSVEQTVALLSCFVFQEKSDENTKLKEDLAGPLKTMQEFARRICKISVESKLNLDEETYVQSFRSELMDVVYAWAKGAKFSQICKMTSVFEGSIIRCMRRLEELLRQMAAAAKTIGNVELESKFSDGINKIKRDIVFANSLYL